MLTIASFALFFVYTLSPAGAQIGAAGQNCTPDEDDKPEKCHTRGQWIVDKEKIECEENYDCCLCGALRCSPNCDSFKANGDFSAYFVPKIIIDGNDDDGAEIDCDGDSSCQGSVIKGTNIKGIKCGGDLSCQTASINAVCVDPCKVECDGDRSCKNSNLDITNVEGVHCGDKACKNARITVRDPDDDFKLECGADRACMGAVINIIVNGDETSELKSIDCGSFKSCLEATITITNIGSAQVKVKEINCEAERACRRSTWKLEGNIKVENCDCEDGACNGATFQGFTCN